MSMSEHPGTLHTESGAARTPVFWLRFTAPIVLLVAGTSLAGLFVPGLYRDPLAWRIQAVAQDFTDLVIVLPLVVVGALLASRGSVRGLLIWLGAVSYLVYAFVIYAFAVQHNALFLAYVAALGCCIWGFAGAMVAADWRGLAAHTTRVPGRTAGGFIVVLAVAFLLLWLGDEVPAVLNGVPPQSLAGTGALTNPVHVLDLAMVLPAMFLIGLGMWRRHGSALVLGGALLVHVLLQDVGILAMMIVARRAGLPSEPALIAGFASLTAVTLALVVRYMARLPGTLRLSS